MDITSWNNAVIRDKTGVTDIMDIPDVSITEVEAN
jgi:hypothetical protein